MDRVDAGTDIAFKIGFTGYSGHLRIEPLPPVERYDPLKSLPDFILPSAFQPETPESIKKHWEEKYLLPELDKDEFSVEKAGKQWDFDWFDRAKVHLEPTLPRTVIVPEYELPFKRPIYWEPRSVEMDVSELMEGAHESGSTPRMPGPAKDFVRGSIGNRPFRPGGLDVSQSAQKVVPEGARSGQWVREILDGGPAQGIPPGFKHGLDLGDLMAHPYSWKVYKDQSEAKSSSDDKLSRISVQFDDLFAKAWEDDIIEESQHRDGTLETHSICNEISIPLQLVSLDVIGSKQFARTKTQCRYISLEIHTIGIIRLPAGVACFTIRSRLEFHGMHLGLSLNCQHSRQGIDLVAPNNAAGT